MPQNQIRFYTNHQLGIHQSLTPDGFLLCTDVPVARTGVQYYDWREGIPVQADANGIIRIIREPNEVFASSAVASFNGKPVTNDHPPEKVSPENWRSYAIGTCLNPRQGDGIIYDSDYLYCDLLITDEEAIRDVRAGKREVSAGYDADYEQIRPGEGRQHQIVGNHVALVDKGRCGPRCAIGDKEMAKTKRPAWFDAVLRAHSTGDEDRLVDTLEKVQDMLGDTWLGEASGRIKQGDSVGSSGDNMGGVHVHLHQGGGTDAEEPEAAVGGAAEAVKKPMPGAEGGEATGGGGGSMEEILQRLAALERAVAILAQEEGGEQEETGEPDTGEGQEAAKEESGSWSDRKGTKDSKAMVGDSTSLRNAWQEMLSRAEFLAPGIKAPTFDSKTSARVTTDSMCSFRRKVLKEALKEDDTKGAVEQLTGGKVDFGQMTCDAVQYVYNGASELVRQSNTRRQTDGVGDGMNYHAAANASMLDTVKHINQKNRERYGIKA